jgi:hypothetical protein
MLLITFLTVLRRDLEAASQSMSTDNAIATEPAEPAALGAKPNH